MKSNAIYSQEELKILLDCIKTANLSWDCFDQAISLIENPKDFEVLFRRQHSLLAQKVFYTEIEEIPLYINNDPWINAIAKWRLTIGH